MGDVVAGAVTAETAREIYGVVVIDGALDETATDRQREAIRKARVGNFDTDPAKKSGAKPIASLSEGLFVVQDERGTHVVSRPASGAQLAVDFHRKDEKPGDDLLLDLATLPRLAA